MGRTDEPDIKNSSNIIRINSGNSSHINDYIDFFSFIV